MKRRYVLLFANIFSKRDWHRFGCDVLEARGYEVVVVQCGYIIGYDLRSFERGDFKILPQARTPKSITELEAILDELNSRDLILLGLHLSQSPEIFIALGKRKLTYVWASLSLIPTTGLVDHRYVLSIQEYFRFQWDTFRGLLHRIKSRAAIVWKYKLDYWRMAGPVLWVRAGTYTPVLTVPVPHLSRAKVIAVESTEILWSRGDADIPEGPYALFIDEAQHNHPDFLTMNRAAPVQAETYFKGLIYFFNKVSTDLNCPVVIATHPKANYSDEQKKRWFGDLAVISGKTPHLIKGANLVLAHSSTAISFAILNRKPIIIMTSDELENSFIQRQLVITSTWIGQRRINVDALAKTEGKILQMPNVDEAKYERYERCFLRPPGASGGEIWEQVAAQFEALSGAGDAK